MPNGEAIAMHRFLVRLRRSPRPDARSRSLGQSVAELALVVPVILLVFAAAADLGRYAYSYVAIENAAKEGVLFGANNPSCEDSSSIGCGGANNVRYRVQSELDANGIENDDGSSIVPAVQCLEPGGVARPSLLECVEGDTYEVSISYDFRLLTPLLDLVVANPITLTSVSRATVLNLAFDPEPGLSVEKLVSTTGAINAAEIVAKCTEPHDIGGDGFYRSPCLDQSTADDPTDVIHVRFDSYRSVEYRIRVANSGDMTLSGITLDESQESGGWPPISGTCPEPPAELTVNQSYQCLLSRDAPLPSDSASDMQWANTVTAGAAGLAPVQDAVTVIIEKPALLHVEKYVSPYELGDDGDGVPSFGSMSDLETALRSAATFPSAEVKVWYWVHVWNEGAKVATSVQIEDDSGPLPFGVDNATATCDPAPTTLDPDAEFFCRYQVTYTTPGAKDNTVTATSPDVLPDANDSAAAAVEVNGTACNNTNDRVVPNLVGMTLTDAEAAWTIAGFTGSISSAPMIGTDVVATQDRQAYSCSGRSTSVELTSVPTP